MNAQSTTYSFLTGDNRCFFPDECGKLVSHLKREAEKVRYVHLLVGGQRTVSLRASTALTVLEAVTPDKDAVILFLRQAIPEPAS